MIIVGLTGSIASGKSEAAKRFAHHGIAVFDADKYVHELYRTQAVAEAIGLQFPGTVSRGQVDRARLSEHLVKMPADFPALEAIIHPMVRAKMLEFLKDQKDGGMEIAVLDVPLLLETGGERFVDRIVLVTSDAETQRRRALLRPGMNEAKLAAMLARQLPVFAKAARADDVVENYGTLEELAAKIDQLVYDIRAKGEVGHK